IMMFGLDYAGKTSLLNCITRSELPVGVLPETTPTIGFNRETVLYKNNCITVWDVGGQEKIRPLWRSYLWNGAVFMFIVDATSPERFPEAKEELHRLYVETRTRRTPFLVVASKMDDGVDSAAFTEIARSLDVEKLAKWGGTLALKVSLSFPDWHFKSISTTVRRECLR
ncbi:ADP-ribosylation factor-like protein, partial [Mycena maculata]